MSENRPLVIVVDGNSFIHRSFHALPLFTNKEGFPTSAITGALNMIVSLQRKYSPDKLIVCFDAKGKNFRHDIYPEYKGNRPPSDPNIGVQFQPLKEIVQAWGMPMLCIDGVEADDTMGTVAIRAVEEGYDVAIATSDKDMRQLVTENIKIVDTKDAGTKEPYGAEGVVERMGVEPHLVKDLLTIMGDDSDGIPGVFNVGKDTAGKWLMKYGSLENVIAHADEIKGKRGEYLRDAIPHLPLSYKLVDIRTDVPLPLPVKELYGTRDEAKLFELVSKYELSQFKRDADVSNPNAESMECDIVVCDTDASISILSNKLSQSSAKNLFIDASDTDSDRICLAINHVSKVYVVDLKSISDVLAERYRKGHFPVLIGNNVKRVVVKMIGSDVLPVHPIIDVKDTRLCYYSHIGARSKLPSISVLNDNYAGLDMSPLRQEFKLDEKTPKWNKVSPDQWSEIKAEELKLAEKIFVAFTTDSSPLSSNEISTLSSEEKLLPLLASLEAQGLSIDASYLKELDGNLETAASEVEAKIKDITGVNDINLNSPKQVGHLLFEVMAIPIKKPSTAEKVLLKLAKDYPVVVDILRYRSLMTLRTRYIQGLLTRIHDDGKIHPQFNQGLALTGRLSAEDPNVQAIPVRSDEGKKVRQAFVSEKGYLVAAADYSQIELRVLAHLSGDKWLINAFLAGSDIHRATASDILGVPYDDVTDDQRRVAKAINFGLIYGMGAKRLAEETGISLKDAKEYIDAYFARYPLVREYLDNELHKAKQNGFVQTITGRKIYTPDVNASNPMIRVHAELSAKNSGIQGSAADIIREAMLNIVSSGILDDNVKLVMQVHDELVFYIKDELVGELLPKLTQLMESAFELAVPLVVEAKSGSNWREAH